MGISRKNCLMVGLWYADLPLDAKKLAEEMIDEGDLDTLSPYYDSDIEDWFVGFKFANNAVTIETLNTCYEDLANEFHVIFNLSPVIVGGADIT